MIQLRKQLTWSKQRQCFETDEFGFIDTKLFKSIKTIVQALNFVRVDILCG